MTGFSLARGPYREAAHHFEVLIHGKSNEMHRKFGEYIYITFFLGEKYSDAEIRPLSYYHPNLFAFFPNSSLYGGGRPTNRPFIEAFSQFEDAQDLGFLVYIIVDQQNQNKAFKLFVTFDIEFIQNLDFMHFSNKNKGGFELEIGKVSALPFDQIIGIHGNLFDKVDDRVKVNNKNIKDFIFLSTRKTGEEVIKMYAFDSPHLHQFNELENAWKDQLKMYAKDNFKVCSPIL